MTNITKFPSRECIIVTEGIDAETGRPIYLLEHVDGDGRIVVGSYATSLEVAKAMSEWRQDGLEVRYE